MRVNVIQSMQGSGVAGLFRAVGVVGSHPSVKQAEEHGWLAGDLRRAWTEALHAAPLSMVAVHAGVDGAVLREAAVSVMEKAFADIEFEAPPTAAKVFACVRTPDPSTVQKLVLLVMSNAIGTLEVDTLVRELTDALVRGLVAMLQLAADTTCDCQGDHTEPILDALNEVIRSADVIRGVMSVGVKGRPTDPEDIAFWSSRETAKEFAKIVPVEIVLASATGMATAGGSA